LAGSAMATAVVGDAAIAVRGEEKHLGFPRVGVQRPAVAEDNGLARAPVFVVDLRSVFGGDGIHGFFYFRIVLVAGLRCWHSQGIQLDGQHRDRNAGNRCHAGGVDEEPASRHTVFTDEFGYDGIHGIDRFGFTASRPSSIQCAISKQIGRLLVKIFIATFFAML
jgi:hypothetical protein